MLAASLIFPRVVDEELRLGMSTHGEADSRFRRVPLRFGLD